jgi:hypothetical protein
MDGGARVTLNISNWRHSATVGEVLIYYTGNLADGRITDPQVRALAVDAWALNLAGLVALTQRRVQPFECEYLATASNLRPWVERDRV